MSKSSNQKLKIIYLMDILMEYTDDDHFLSMQEIIKHLSKFNINAERKSIYDDLQTLELYGIDIIRKKGRNPSYAIGKRKFELAELKLLVESVQSSKFITYKKSIELIKKLENLCSKYQSNQLQHEVYLVNRIKNMNESIYYIVDDIQQALANKVQIEFNYMKWDMNRNLVFRHDGEKYIVSPLALSLNDDNYYLIAYDNVSEKIKHYRVDKMANVKCLSEKSVGKEKIGQLDTATYAKQMFSMFGGVTQKVKLLCNNNLIGVIMDRFGKNIYLRKVDDDTFYVVVEVAVSEQFFGWIFGLGNGVKIVSPKSVVDMMKESIEQRSNLYSNEN